MTARSLLLPGGPRLPRATGSIRSAVAAGGRALVAEAGAPPRLNLVQHQLDKPWFAGGAAQLLPRPRGPQLTVRPRLRHPGGSAADPRGEHEAMFLPARRAAAFDRAGLQTLALAHTAGQSTDGGPSLRLTLFRTRSCLRFGAWSTKLAHRHANVR